MFTRDHIFLMTKRKKKWKEVFKNFYKWNLFYFMVTVVFCWYLNFKAIYQNFKIYNIKTLITLINSNIKNNINIILTKRGFSWTKNLLCYALLRQSRNKVMTSS